MIALYCNEEDKIKLLALLSKLGVPKFKVHMRYSSSDFSYLRVYLTGLPLVVGVGLPYCSKIRETGYKMSACTLKNSRNIQGLKYLYAKNGGSEVLGRILELDSTNVAGSEVTAHKSIVWLSRVIGTFHSLYSGQLTSPPHDSDSVVEIGNIKLTGKQLDSAEKHSTLVSALLRLPLESSKIETGYRIHKSFPGQSVSGSTGGCVGYSVDSPGDTSEVPENNL